MKDYRFGLFCSLSDNSLSTNHSCTLRTLSEESVLIKTKQNAEDLIYLLDFCEKSNIKTFRLGNSFIPFLSHKDFNPMWLQSLEPILDATKERLQDFDIRITQHPGQYTILNSPKEEVLQNSLRELKSFFWLFDKLGVDENGIILIHGGGGYGNKAESLERLIATISQNPWLKKRLALENDERIFNAHEILQVCTEEKIPFVFDIYHHSLLPSEFNLKDYFKSYSQRTPKIHLSSKGKGRFGNHGDFILLEDFQTLQNLFGEQLYKVDIMIEAKQKEKAIEKLKNEIKHC